MSTDLRPLSTTELVDKTFTLYRSNFLIFVGIAAVAYLIPLILKYFVNPIGPADLMDFDSRTALVLLISEIGDIVASAIALGATAYAVSAIYFGGVTRISESLRKASAKIGRIIAIRFAVRFLTMIGLFVLVLPGLFWLASYSLAIPAAALENLPVNKALTRSNELANGSRRRILDVYVMVYLLRFVVQWIFRLIERLISSLSHAPNLNAYFPFEPLLEFGVDTLVFPLLFISLVLVYYDQRVRKEAFDPQLLMEGLDGVSATGAAQQTALGAGGTKL
jgi:hypothetical protein